MILEIEKVGRITCVHVERGNQVVTLTITDGHCPFGCAEWAEEIKLTPAQAECIGEQLML